jgi:two-component sensor histidine kinase
MGNSQSGNVLPEQCEEALLTAAPAAIQAALNRVIRESEEKSLFLAELQHRMKNNLQTVQSLLRLQKTYMSNSAARQELVRLEMHIAALNDVGGELLMPDANQVVDLETYLRRLMGKLKDVFATEFRPVHFRLELDRIEVPFRAATNIGLLVNEAVTNSFKHAVSKGADEICLTLQKKRRAALLTVSDNGPGFDGAGQEHLGGALLMYRLARRIRAVVERDRQWPGTRYTIRIPLPACKPAAAP